MELRGSGATELEEDDDEDVLPFRAPRRDLESVTWGEEKKSEVNLCHGYAAACSDWLTVPKAVPKAVQQRFSNSGFCSKQ